MLVKPNGILAAAADRLCNSTDRIATFRCSAVVMRHHARSFGIGCFHP
ncbi:hypothetical protein [Chroococcidiopsis sp. CCNUC1]|nr:hypothetical protein [Chroococcidiopsis sp. CCNUC1]URD53502.1 hypothetical protein M5J74_29470 [Chroococcidiopsis sp. CCNUC1]